MCALVYQVAWLRELRMVFGGSTAASAAVLAIFMGGLGLGGALLGKRADRHPSPLRLYSNLELSIAVTVALSPFLLWFVRELYIVLGGSMTLGLGKATLVRLAFSSVVLGIPTFLMGGTLPAAARAIATSDDVGRKSVAILYGANTLGAVVGASFATFYCLEVFGIRRTLLLACLVNALVGLSARALARRYDAADRVAPVSAAGEPVEAPAATSSVEPGAPASYVLVAAGIVGFVFLLMELVWYRMLSPLLGGSTYTFGLILAVALLGIGLGSAAYAVVGHRRPATIGMFSLSVGLEALFMAIPFAMGDRVAILADVLRNLSSLGFYGHLFGWAIVTSLVIFPAAMVSGFQFPLLIALLGQGKRDLGKQTGLAYAWNTGGAILGSLAGGFGALPLLTALGTWKAVIYLLAALGSTAVLLSLRRAGSKLMVLVPVGTLVASILLVQLPLGPTAVWRHFGIGAGRTGLKTDSRNNLIRTMLDARRYIKWEGEGIESSVALGSVSGLSFIINGKNDGNARGDASTQVMSGLIGALIHPEPKKTAIVGLGTGSTAGWLGAVDTMEEVDVFELEPLILEMARRSKAVNQDVLNNPKVNIIIGDARELLLTVPKQYDLIVSEPSNPFRVGISSLYTQEFYEAVRVRLAPGGLFSQWVQAYEIDTQTFRTIYATLCSVFPVVETWQTNPLDLIMVCSMEPILYSEPELRKRLAEEPFASAALYAWSAIDLEGVFSRYVANSSLAQLVAEQEKGVVNTDDRNRVEYGFARTVGQGGLFMADELRASAVDLNAHRPEHLEGHIDWDLVEEQRIHMTLLLEQPIRNIDTFPEDRQHRARAVGEFVSDDVEAALKEWRAQSREPIYPLELMLVAEGLADEGSDEALKYIEALRATSPTVADAILARLAMRQERMEDAVELLERCLLVLREDPWPLEFTMERVMGLTQAAIVEDASLAPRMLEILREPFSLLVYDDYRRELVVALASRIGFSEAAEAIEKYEPYPLWTEKFLQYRALVYEKVEHPKAELARNDAVQFLRNTHKKFGDLLELKATKTPPADAPPPSYDAP